jgi:DNA/RNA-binding domain of Phe-tRNA-synthetase-like protein
VDRRNKNVLGKKKVSIIFSVSDVWRMTYPGAAAGILAMHKVNNLEGHAGLEQRKSELEASLRARYSGFDRRALELVPPFPAYDVYYKRFKKTYHVYLQLESIIFKGRTIPSVASLVEAMFMAELKNMLLTAGHDLATLHPPVSLDVATGNEHYIVLKGQDQTLKPGDMFIKDGLGVMSSIIYGPDQRTQITPSTHEVLFTVYAPPGIDEQAVYTHLEYIRECILLVSPEAEVSLLQVLSTQ